MDPTASPLGFFAGVVYPSPEDISDNGLAGYVLTRGQLRTLRDKLPGCPLTLEHAGIQQAAGRVTSSSSVVDVYRYLNQAATSDNDLTKKPIGSVTQAYLNGRNQLICIFVFDLRAYNRVAQLIGRGILRGLSMSHLHHGDDPRPLELSLCQQPARPGCFISMGPVGDPTLVDLYKAIDESSPTKLPTLTMTEQNSTPSTVDPMTAALAAMTPESRKLVSAALDAMNTKLDTAKKENDKLAQENKQLQAHENVDQALLNAQIKQFISHIGNDQADKFGIAADTCSEQLNHANPTIVKRAVDRLLMCANTTMMQSALSKQQPVVQLPPSVASETALPAPDTVAAPVVQSNKRTADQAFEPEEQDAASKLRDALRNYTC